MALELGALEGSRLARASWDALPQAGYYAVCEEAGHVAEGIAWHHTLINIGQQVPPGFSRFEEVWEWVGDDIESGRERYRYYRDRGYPLQHDHSLVAENWTQ